MNRVAFGLRFDLRAFPAGVDHQRLYQACVEMTEWADQRDFTFVRIAEHHGSLDGYLPSPVVLAGALATRTKQIRIQLRALLAPFHHPIRLAEDLAVIDVVSNGRLDVILGAGYRPEEFEMFGVPMARRGLLVEEVVSTLREAWTGEAFAFRGAPARVRPVPVQTPGPPIILGGSSSAAARRAARIADGFQPHSEELYELFRTTCVDLGRPLPPPLTRPGPLFLHVADDPDRAWSAIAQHAVFENNSYAAWNASSLGLPFVPEDDATRLRAAGGYVVATPDECVELARSCDELSFHPLMGGLDPDLAWASLELFASSVLPRLA